MQSYVQQIMLGSVTGSETAARRTLQRIRDAGYDGLELNRFMLHPSSLLVRLMTYAAGMPTGKGGSLDWHALLQEFSLGVASLHVDLGSLERECEEIYTEAESYQTKRLVITGMYRFDYTSADAVTQLAQRLQAAGEKAAQAGFQLFYHNHNVELSRTDRGVRAMDILLNRTDLSFEFDSFWFADGGADAGAWMRKLGPRMRLWHVTDRGARQVGPSMTPILKCDSVELGTGNMDLNGLSEIALTNGVEAVILESHRNWIDKDPVKSLEKSARWLRRRFA